MKLERVAADSPDAAVEHVEVEAAREAGDHASRSPTSTRADLLHVAAHEDVRQAGGGRELAHVVVRRLRLVAERQRVRREGSAARRQSATQLARP